MMRLTSVKSFLLCDTISHNNLDQYLLIYLSGLSNTFWKEIHCCQNAFGSLRLMERTQKFAVCPCLTCIGLCFRDMFGEDCVSSKDGSVLCVTVDGKTANVSLDTRVWTVKHFICTMFNRNYANKYFGHLDPFVLINKILKTWVAVIYSTGVALGCFS